MPDEEFQIQYEITGKVTIAAKNKKQAVKLFDAWIERGVGAASDHINIAKKVV